LASRGAPANAIIFVTDISQATVDQVRPFVLDLQNKGCNLTFVAVGNNVQAYLLKQLSSKIITWDIDQEPEPDNWEQLFWSAYGCTN
jgi:hypothetical protein